MRVRSPNLILASSDGTNRVRPAAVPFGFAYLAASDSIMKHRMLLDAVAIIGTIDIVFGELDR